MSCTFGSLPEDALNAIFLHVPAVDLVLNCSLVCRRWSDILSGRFFWLQRLEVNGTMISERNRQLLLDNGDYDLCIYILRAMACGLLPFNRNLIKNPCGQESRKHWLYDESQGVDLSEQQEERGRGSSRRRGRRQIRSSSFDSDDEEPQDSEEDEEEEEPEEEDSSESDQENEDPVFRYSRYGFSIEESPIGALPIPEEAGVPTQHCFVTSYDLAVRTQLIDITKYKMKEGVMELLKPTICYSQWVAARFDCASEADLCVIVISGDWELSPKTIHWDTDQKGVERREWYKMEGQAQSPLPIDKILYRSSGKDRQFWAGNFGSKTTACSLILQI